MRYDMATITKTPSGTFKVLIRKAGLSPQIKTFKSRSNAEKWARLVESEMDRGVSLIGKKLTGLQLVN
jgi:hypothetical protein